MESIGGIALCGFSNIVKSYINSLQIADRFGLHLYLYPPIIVTLGNKQCALMQIVKSLLGRKYDLNDQKIKWNSVSKFLFLEKGAGKIKISCLKGGLF